LALEMLIKPEKIYNFIEMTKRQTDITIVITVS